jgi:hypothetical protein
MLNTRAAAVTGTTVLTGLQAAAQHLVFGHRDAEREARRVALDREVAASFDVEAQLAIGRFHRLEAEVVDVGVREVVASRRNADVDLAGKVREVRAALAVVCEHVLHRDARIWHARCSGYARHRGRRSRLQSTQSTHTFCTRLQRDCLRDATLASMRHSLRDCDNRLRLQPEEAGRRGAGGRGCRACSSRSIGRTSMSSSGSRPAIGEPVRLRTLSMPVITDVRPISCTLSNVAPASSIVMPRSWMFARVVMSPHPFSPYGRMRSASLRHCVDVSSPLGTYAGGRGG